MPRPRNGYTNSAGQPVPGTNDVTGRYNNSGALIHWAHKQGKQVLPLYDRSAIDIGSAVHKMAELDLIGASDREIEAALHDYLSAPNHLAMAHTSLKAFREWWEQCRVTPIKQEISLVSERYQYGRTPDLIAIINNGIGLIDFKTGKDQRGLEGMEAPAHRNPRLREAYAKGLSDRAWLAAPAVPTTPVQLVFDFGRHLNDLG